MNLARIFGKGEIYGNRSDSAVSDSACAESKPFTKPFTKPDAFAKIVISRGAGFICAAVFFLLAFTASGATYHAAPSGSGSTCSDSSRCSLGTLIGKLSAGDIGYMHAGTYSGHYTLSNNGTSSAPITLRSYTGEWAKIDGGTGLGATITIHGNYWILRDFELYGSNTKRTGNPEGTDVTRGNGVVTEQTPGTAIGTKLINLVIHDTQGNGLWQDAVNAEMYGCISYYNGWVTPGDRGHGHGIYVQNEQPRKTIRNNIFFQNFSHGIHSYSESGGLSNITLDGNISFNNGIVSGEGGERNLLLGGGVTAANPIITNNALYFKQSDSPTSSFKVGYSAQCSNAVITGNYSANGTDFSGCTNPATLTGNTFYGNFTGVNQGNYPNNTYFGLTKPTANVVKVYPNQYEAGRANVAIYNWQGFATVDVDLSGVLTQGDSYEIKNVQNFFGPAVKTGVYGGGTVAFPAGALTAVAPIGIATPPNSGPEFNAYVVRILGGGGSSTPTPIPSTPPSATATMVAGTSTPTRTATPIPSPSSSPTKTATPLPGQANYFEAESGSLTSPMTIATDPLASGGQYVFSNTGEQGKATYTVVALAPNVVHYLWHKVLCASSASDSFYLSLDGGTESIDDTCEGSQGPSWTWHRVSDRTVGLGATWARTLSGGTHTLVFRGRDPNTKLDRLAITTDANWTPSDSTPTPTKSPIPSSTATPKTICVTVTPGGP